MNVTLTVGIVVLQDNNVLLVREGEKSGHLTGVYNTPAGRIEDGETPMHAAVRELEEESGLNTTEADLVELPKKYTADIKRKSGETVRFYHTVFYCKKYSGSLRTGEDVTPEWVTLGKLSSLRLLPNIDDMILQAREYLASIHLTHNE
ncbi:MAG: NUDIX hydrolase [Candidatus Levyibacteriota bacterium]